MDSVNRFGPELILLSAAGIIILADIGGALAGAGAGRGGRGGVGRGVVRRRLLAVLQLPVRGDRRYRRPLVDRPPEGEPVRGRVLRAGAGLRGGDCGCWGDEKTRNAICWAHGYGR